MTADVETYALAPVMKLDDCQGLDQFLRDMTDGPVHLDGADVTRLGGLTAQLIAAHRHLRKDNDTAVKIVNPSPDMVRDLALLGLDRLLGDQEAAQ